jgi:PAS domain S-box-containing protein
VINVLYVDDEPVLLETGRVFLERSGTFSVDTALTGARALDMIHAKAYDVIIADYQMTDINGLDLLKSIRREFADQPFIIFTGKGREEVAIEAYEHGVDFYVQKGGDPRLQFAELAHKIQKAVENHQIKRQLLETEERLQQFFRDFEGIAFQIDPNDRFLFIEGKVEVITGYSREEIQSGNVSIGSLIHEDNRGLFAKGWQKLFSIPGFRFDSPIRIIRKDGSIRWLHGFIHNISSSDGAILYIQGALYDITDLKTAQDEIIRTEAKWRSIITRAPVIISILDRNANFLFINKAHPPLTVSSLIGTSAFRILAPDQEPVLRSALDRVFSIGEVMRFESPVRLSDHVTEWLSHQISPVMWNDNEPAALVVSVVITERKWLEQNLRESEEQYRAIVSASADGIAILDPPARLRFASPRMYDIFEFPRDRNIIGISVLDFVDPSFHAIALDRIARSLSGDIESEPFEYLLRKNNGTSFWAELVSSPLRDDAGAITGLLVLARDISRRKKSEQALFESERNYRSIIENMQDMFYRTDLEGNILMINPHGARLAGYNSPEEMKGLNTMRDIYMNPYDRERFMALLEEKGSVNNFITTLKTRDGRAVIVSASSHFFRDEQGNVAGVEGLLHDITDLKQTEEELRINESRFRTLFEAAEDAIFIKDGNGRYILVNPAMERVMSVSAQQFLTATDEELYGREAAARTRAEDERVIRGEIVRVETTLAVNGQGRTFRIIKVPIRNDRGVITGICGICREIT